MYNYEGELVYLLDFHVLYILILLRNLRIM